LRKKFRSNDSAQQEEQSAFFEQWLRDCQSRKHLNIKEYLEEFQIRVERCIAAEMIEPERKGYYLVKGLPFDQATKILQKFRLSTMRYRDFNFEEISAYLMARINVEEEARMLNPAEATRKISLKQEFKPPVLNAEVVSVPKLNSQTQLPPTTMLKATAEQSPPGVPAAQDEVDVLSEKLFQLKVNRTSLVNVLWSPREAELLANQSIAAYVQQVSDKRIAGVQSAGETAQRRPFAQASDRPQSAFNCYACDKPGHTKDKCPEIVILRENGWLHQNANRALEWGTEDKSQGYIRGLSGSGWLPVILSHIKRKWIKEDQDPLTTKAPWLDGPSAAIQNNSVLSSMNVEEGSGLISAEDYEAFWEHSAPALDGDDDSYAMQAAQIQQKMLNRRPIDRRVLGTPKVSKPTTDAAKKSTPASIMKRVEKPHSVQPKTYRDVTTPEPIPPLRQATPLRQVVDKEMVDAALSRSFKPSKAKRDPAAPKKIRFVEGIPSNLDKVI